MDKDFSIDDILAEVEKRRSDKPDPSEASEVKPRLASLTEELDAIDQRRNAPEPTVQEALPVPREKAVPVRKPEPKPPVREALPVREKPAVREAAPEREQPVPVLEKPTPKPVAPVVHPKKASGKDLSVTDILDSKELRRHANVGVTQILDGEELKRRADSTPHKPRPSESKKPPRAAFENSPGNETPHRPADPYSPNEKPRRGLAKEKKPKGDIVYEKAKVLPKPILSDDEPEKAAIKASVKPLYIKPPASLVTPDTEDINELMGYDETADIEVASGERPELFTADIEIRDASFEFPRVEENAPVELARRELTPEEKAQRMKNRDQALLKRDLALETPEEQIDALNPYDVKNRALPFAEEQEIVMDLSGDTQSIAGNDLKELAASTADDHNAMTTAEVAVKRYTPPEKPEVPDLPETAKAKRSNTALLDSLNKAIKDKQEQKLMAETLSLTGEHTRALPSVPTHALNIDYKKQILADGAAMPIGSAPALAEQKLHDLASKRKRKIKDFVLEDIEQEDELDEDETHEDFDSYDASGQIWQDLCASHKGLNIRLLILFVLTAALVFITVMNDLGQNLAYRFIGTDIEVLFFDKRYDAPGFLYLNLIIGILGLGACSSVITGGLAKLFSGKGDCDSICAVSSVVSLVAVIPFLASGDFLQRGKANIFIAVGLAALLFNTIGKLLMIVRAKRNFRFISGDSAKYYAQIVEDEQTVRAFTKGITHELPVLAAMRKTEFLTDFLKNSYCNDLADKMSRMLTPIIFGVAVLMGVIAYFLPGSDPEMNHNIYWALTVGVGMLSVLSPFSIMFLVNNPLLRASKSLRKTNSAVLGYNAAVDFSEVNSTLMDASGLFPAGSVAFRNIKRCQQANSLNSIAIDEAIITAASLAIKSGSILTYMFYDMIAGKSELLYEVDSPIYEVNMGMSGWIGNRRIMLGNREQMKHHSIKVPDIRKERKYCSENGDVVYLAIGGEAVSMFFIEIIPNPEIGACMRELDRSGVSVVVRTRDSLVTVGKLADVFEVSPERLKVIPASLHDHFEECTKYTSRGSGAVSCSGTFTSFAHALIASKKLVRDISFTSSLIYAAMFLAVLLGMVFMLFVRPDVFTSTNILIYNTGWLGAMLVLQGIRKYQ